MKSKNLLKIMTIALKQKNRFTNSRMKKTVGLILISVFQFGCSLFGVQNEEEPKYEVLLKKDNKEIRSYSSYLAATTWVEGNFKEAQGPAFRTLADFIFGKNSSKEKISMTAPVVQAPQNTQGPSEVIKMTAPVLQGPEKNGWRMSFMMPSKYTKESLPQPLNPKIEIIEVPAKLYAVIQFSGFWTHKKNLKKAEELKAWLTEQNSYTIVSEPQFAGYNPPWTLPFLRRNEMMIEVVKK